ncbi:hypothetical protein, partial [Cohnella sp. GbtcB17]|uniref:hypothetical protein n=1 Tax=Cohnella sp. GbtcB17 TaxID=2824762 RepID=UPI001C30B147
REGRGIESRFPLHNESYIRRWRIFCFCAPSQAQECGVWRHPINAVVPPVAKVSAKNKKAPSGARLPQEVSTRNK